MSDVENKIKQILEKNVKVNLKSVKDRAKLTQALTNIIEEEVSSLSTDTDSVDSPEIDVFETVKIGVQKKKEEKKIQEQNSIANNPAVNPMAGYVAGQVAKMVTDDDINAYYDSVKKEKPKPKSKPKKKTSVEDVIKKDVKIPSRNPKRNLSSLGNNSKKSK